MKEARFLRIGAVTALLAIVFQVAAAFLEQQRVGEADEAIRDIADSGAWEVRWFVHLVSIVALVAAIAFIARTFSDGPAKEWARIGQPLFVIGGALGAAEVLVGASTKELADGWASAAHGAELPYFAAFEGTWTQTVNLDFGAIFVYGLYFATLAASILSGDLYARWLGWASAVAAVLGVVGIVLELWSPVGTALNGIASLLVFVVLIGLAVSMWRAASRWAAAAPSAA